MADALVTIRLLGLPVSLHARSSEHSDELMREFTYIRAQSEDHDAPTVPGRLLDLVDELQGRYAGFTTGTEAELDQAINDRRDRIDLEYRVPPDVGPMCVHLGELLDAADDFCRQGELLLTLSTPDDVVAYRRWFLDEFIRQSAGEEPRPFSSVAAPPASG
jgi:hypothetical protein